MGATHHDDLHKDVMLSSGGITASLVLAEPTIFLSGFTKSEQAERPPALVRGSLVIRVQKPTKIKSVSLVFKGISRTEWPEGIPFDKAETQETNEVFSHKWRLFSTKSSNAENSSGAHSVVALESSDGTRHSDELHPTSSVAPHSIVNQHEAVNKGYRVFQPAEYIYNFELMLPQRLPETLKCNFGQVKWSFTLGIDRHGTFKPKLTGHKDITLLRTLGPSNLESSEPIVINRNWEDVLHYEIVIAGKAFAIGQRFNIAFGLVPLAKVKCHRIRLYITEHTEYYCRNRRIHRVEPTHKFLLLERIPEEGIKGDLLGAMPPGLSGLTEFEFDVIIPQEFPARRDQLRPNANTEYIKVHHWIKAVLRLSRSDLRPDGKAKCYEVSIDSPITLVDRTTLQSNDLPDYVTGSSTGAVGQALKPYQEFIQKEGAPSEEIQRAILFTRKPSIAPPPFDTDTHPPELFPPKYEALQENLASYRERYNEYLRAEGRAPLETTDKVGVDAAETKAKDSRPERDASPQAEITSGEGFMLSAMAMASAVNAVHTGDNASDHSDQSERSSSDAVSEDSGSVSTTPTSLDERQAAPEAGESLGAGNEAVAADERISVSSQIIWSEDANGMPQDPNPDVGLNTSHETTRVSIDRDDDEEHSPTESPQGLLGQMSLFSPKLQSPSSPPSGPGSPRMPPEESTRPPTSLLTRAVLSSPVPPMSPGLASQDFQIPSSGTSPVAGPSSPRSKRGSLSGDNSLGGGSSGSGLTLGSSVSPRNSIPVQMHRLRGLPVQYNGVPSSRPGSVSQRSPWPGQKAPAVRSGSSGSSHMPPGFSTPWESNARQIFGEGWMDREANTSGGGPPLAGSQGSSRYFRQSSIVSVDLSRQGDRRDSRRQSHVSEVQEVTDWYPLSRANSESSIAVSISEYEGLTDRAPITSTGVAPLLGHQDSEVDIGLEWENDFEDYGGASDRGSIVSSFYMLTP